MRDNSVYKKALKLAIPMMIQNGITNAVGLVDNVMVGSLGTNPVTAVSIIGQLFFVFNLAVFGGLSGPGIYAAQYYGQKNVEGFRQTFRIKHWISGFCLLLGLCAFVFAAEPLIGLYMRGESSGEVDPVATMALAKEYLSVMIIGMAPFAITQIYAGSMRETGESFMPMMAGVASVAVDVVFNYLLIFGSFGFPQLGVRGAAIATVLARFVEMAIVLIAAFSKRKKFTFLQGAYKTLLIPKDVAAKIIKKSLPIFFNEFLWAAGIAAITQSYSTLGLDIVTGLNISNTLCNLFNVVFVALGNAVGIVIGQMLGASEYEKAKKYSLRLAAFTTGITVAVAGGLIAVSFFFPNFYDTTAQIKELGRNFIIITALFFPVQAFLNALYFTLRSGGKTLITFLFDSVFSWTITLPLTILLCSFSGLPVIGIFTIVQAADVIKVIIGFILVKKGYWISNIVE